MELEAHANEKAKLLFQDWAQQEGKGIGDDAIKRSEAVIQGKVTEHLVPFFPDFKSPTSTSLMPERINRIHLRSLVRGKRPCKQTDPDRDAESDHDQRDWKYVW